MHYRLYFCHANRDLPPDPHDRMKITLPQGVAAEYSGGGPVKTSPSGLPYRKTNGDHCVLIAEKFRNDVAAHRMLVFATESAD